MELKGKKLLILGGTNASVDIVKQAKKMGIYTIVTDDKPVEERISKQIADESRMISTTDYDNLLRLIKEEHIDGVFSGPSEFNIQNVIHICSLAGLPCYATQEQWDVCQNKEKFKSLCRKFGVPCVPEYEVDDNFSRKNLDKVKYPVIVKPVDGCSSSGLSICYNEEELINGVKKAKEKSKTNKALIEKCITSDYGFGCRYIANDGQIFLSATCDRYTVDQPGGKVLISSGAVFPSKKTDEYIRDINSRVIEMFKSIGIKNGTMFLQALVDGDDGKIYFHEMGLRLSGGLIFSMLEASCGYNDVQMMIRYALGGAMVTEEDLPRIDPYMKGHFIGSITIPIKTGTIGTIDGIDLIRSNANVLDIVQYYHVGETIRPEYIGTLAQLFCRVKMMTNTICEYKEMVEWIQNTVKIDDVNGNDMIYRKFDTKRIR